MFVPNSYIEEKLTKQRIHDHVRDAEHDRIVQLASQASDSRARGRGSWIRHLSWAGRLLSAVLGAA